MIELLIFIIGLCIGSFINAFQYRQEIRRKNTGRSFCPKCKRQLAWHDLIPVVSWIILLGKCRYCKKQISTQYPLVELLTGTLFVAFGLKSGFIAKFNDLLLGNYGSFEGEIVTEFSKFFCLALIIFCFVTLALHDYKTKYILSALVYLAIVASGVLLLLNYHDVWSFWPIFKYLYPYLIPAIIASAIFYLIYALSKGKWMGAGDIEIAFLIGIFLGWPNTSVAFYIAFVSGAIVGTVLLITQRAKLKSEVPFGPFLIAGTLTAYLFGAQIISIYDRIFLGF